MSHCLKAKSIAYLIDMSMESEVAPWDQYESLKKELNIFSPKFAEKDYTIIGTKADLPGTEMAR